MFSIIVLHSPKFSRLVGLSAKLRDRHAAESRVGSTTMSLQLLG
jgi:hypothetical protein